MRYTGWCRDYGGLWGLSCGYWARSEVLRDRHWRVRHTLDEDVSPVEPSDERYAEYT